METVEDKTTLLDIFGVTLTFPTFAIKGINGEDYNNINLEIDAINHNTILYYWQITEEDMQTYLISINDTFTISTNTMQMTYKITNVIPDNYGWVKIFATLQDEVNV